MFHHFLRNCLWHTMPMVPHPFTKLCDLVGALQIPQHTQHTQHTQRTQHTPHKHRHDHNKTVLVQSHSRLKICNSLSDHFVLESKLRSSINLSLCLFRFVVENVGVIFYFLILFRSERFFLILCRCVIVDLFF
jgi:hypothetical protein